jgi:Ca-activated chloride channel family protein
MNRTSLLALLSLSSLATLAGCGGGDSPLQLPGSTANEVSNASTPDVKPAAEPEGRYQEEDEVAGLDRAPLDTPDEPTLIPGSPAPYRSSRGELAARVKSDAKNAAGDDDKTAADGWAPAPDGERANTESYTDYGINDLVLTERDRYSTFSIDVDTASYSIARRKLQSGQLPPTASVRVEEFVNYFPYEYTPPTGDAPFSVNMEAAPNPFQPGHHIMRFGVQGQLPDDAGRKTVHLTFLVDTSGSMNSSDKLGLVKQSLRYLVGNLRPGDTVALATYAGNVRKVLDPTAASELDVINSAIEALSAGGGTAMSSGVDVAYAMADAAFVRGHENRVIVLSDGDATIGRASHEQILRQIEGYADKGVTLSTIGVGMGNYQDTLMEQLADQGDGNYFYIDTFAEAEKVFGEDLAGTLQVIARDVKIQVEFNPDAVMGYRLIGYENRDIADRDFRNDAVDAGEIGAGHRVTALYDVVLRDGYRDADGGLATVRIRNKRPGADSAAVEWDTVFPARLVRRELAEASADFRLAYGAACFAELLRGSPYTAEISYSDLLEMLNHRDQPLDSGLMDLIAVAGRLSGEASLTTAR